MPSVCAQQQLVLFGNLGQFLGGDLDVDTLIVGGHYFATALQGVTAQSYDYSHVAVL
jgi:hypothetical protein